jgi:hypothetical protein
LEEDSNEDDEEEADEADEIAETNQETKFDNGKYFGYIDETGTVVYVEFDSEDCNQNSLIESNFKQDFGYDTSADSMKAMSAPTNSIIMNEDIAAVDAASLSLTTAAPAEGQMTSEYSEKADDQNISSNMENLAINSKLSRPGFSSISNTAISHNIMSTMTPSQYFLERTEPCSRINPGLLIK